MSRVSTRARWFGALVALLLHATPVHATMDIANNGAVMRDTMLSVHGGSSSLEKETATRYDRSPAWDRILSLDSVSNTALKFGADTANAAILFTQPNEREQPNLVAVRSTAAQIRFSTHAGRLLRPPFTGRCLCMWPPQCAPYAQTEVGGPPVSAFTAPSRAPVHPDIRAL